MKDGKCPGCGARVPWWFTVEKCNKCLYEMTEKLVETRKNKPTLVRYYRVKP